VIASAAQSRRHQRPEPLAAAWRRPSKRAAAVAVVDERLEVAPTAAALLALIDTR
jgi:hypothetical protein